MICERDIKETLLIVDDRKAIRVASFLNINNIDTESLLEKFLSTNKIDKKRFNSIIDLLYQKRRINNGKYNEWKKIAKIEEKEELEQDNDTPIR